LQLLAEVTTSEAPKLEKPDETDLEGDIAGSSAAPDIGAPQTTASSADAGKASGEEESKTEILELLERLAALHRAGVLTEEEFASKKDRTLGRL
jgi:hypothetical protein